MKSFQSFWAIILAACLSACSTINSSTPATLRYNNSFYVPAKITMMVARTAQIGTHQYELLFYNEVGQQVDSEFLVGQLPPWSCHPPEPVGRTLTVGATDSTTNDPLRAQLSQVSSNPIVYEVKVLDSSVLDKVLAVAQIMIPTTLGCNFDQAGVFGSDTKAVTR